MRERQTDRQTDRGRQTDRVAAKALKLNLEILSRYIHELFLSCPKVNRKYPRDI